MSETPEIRYGIHDSPFGHFVVALLSGSVARFSFLETRSDANAQMAIQEHWPHARLVRDDPGTKVIAEKIFSQQRKQGAISCVLEGTDFQMNVWQALTTIPKGKTATYHEIAKQIGAPKAARAVGVACGRNPIGFLIPCHRVLASDGSLGGYRWGTKRKEAILAWES
jgi:AraC family transcriptional regulator of adaptative response/methylated-DNA-[protein]-cysteine methyltransferase